MRATRCVGRDEERAALLEVLRQGGPLTVFVHGPAGAGKSTLLEAFSHEARARGATVLGLDCRRFEPTGRGFLAALGETLGMSPEGDEIDGNEIEGLEEVGQRLRGLPGGPTIITLDTYEVLRMCDPWIRQVLAPALEDRVRLVLAGREPPVPPWLHARGGDASFRSLALGSLSDSQAEELLMGIGFSQRDARSVNRVACGHPLALQVAGIALRERPRQSIAEAAIPRVVDELIRLYLDDVDPATRQTLDAASCLRRVTIPLLGAMLPALPAAESVARLRSLPFVEEVSDGLRLHEAVQAAVATRLGALDPHAQRSYRAAAWRQLRSEVRAATRAELWRYTADMLFLLQNPVIREAFFPTTSHDYSIEPARPEDGPSILSIIERHEPAESASLLGLWWQKAPASFRAVRDRSGAVVGTFSMIRAHRVPAGLAQADPVVGAWRAYLRRSPPTGSSEVLFQRTMLSRDAGEAPSPVMAAMWVDIKRTYMELRPNLARIYAVLADPSPYVDVLDRLGFEILAETVDIGRAYHLACLDFGPGSVDGWLARIAAEEIGVADEGLLDPVNRQLVLEGKRVQLTPLEFGVLRHLLNHRGQAVKRLTLLEEVWGHGYEEGSNVVDVVVRAVRKKLGSEGGVIETVWGLGYRYVPAPEAPLNGSPLH